MSQLMSNQQFNANNVKNQAMTKQQKIGVVVLCLLGVFVLAFWYSSLKKDLLYAPYGGINPETLQKQQTDAATTQLKYEASKSQVDTDKDGLTDADETNIYGTSPYIEDSDGDGILDGQEIADKTDPNCPKGQSCAQTGLYGIGSTPTSSLGTTATSSLYSTGATQAQALKEAFGETPDPVELRKVLMASADEAYQAKISQLSDSQLIELYKKTLNELPLSGQTTQE